MGQLKRYVSGGHTRVEIRWHLLILVAGYWGLVLCAWLGYPAANHFSVTTQMLSALGSFENRHNPQWYWLFSVAMVYCGACMTPVMLYVRRRFVAVSAWGASVGAVFFLAGCAAIALVGLFPYAHRDVLGWQLAHLHITIAGLVAACFSLGVIWHGLLLLKDRLTRNALARQGTGSYVPFIGPFLVCFPALAALAYKIRWESIREAFHASAPEALHDISRAFDGMASFPLLEHLAIRGLTIFVVWFTVILPGPKDKAAQ